jgi:hypothetical protein
LGIKRHTGVNKTGNGYRKTFGVMTARKDFSKRVRCTQVFVAGANVVEKEVREVFICIHGQPY